MAFFSQSILEPGPLPSCAHQFLMPCLAGTMLRSGSELWSRNVRVLSRGFVDRNALVAWTMHQSNIMEAS